MKNSVFLFILFSLCVEVSGQGEYLYDASEENPFGLPNPDAPEQVKDWADLIGICDCKSSTRNQDGTWADTIDMEWRWKYILNGWGVQDETFKKDGKHSGSIRQYIADSSKWYVHYYSSAGPTPILSAWEGNKTESGDIMLYNEQKAPNGMEGYYKILFSEISADGFKWNGAWVDKAESFEYPTWRISCRKRE